MGDKPRLQFNRNEVGVRGFVCHMIQNCIYKHGQTSTLFFALGFDGTEAYDAPFPNRYYRGVHDDEIAAKLIEE